MALLKLRHISEDCCCCCGDSLSIGSFTWDSATVSPDASQASPFPTVTSTHLGMRRCLLLDNGTVNYYLNQTDSTLKADGTPSDLSGADGMVMVEIPKFYTKRELIGTETTWSISNQPISGYTVHPAFVKDGVEVNYRYYSAYDACVFSNSGSNYISGLNLDNAGSLLSFPNDKLSSVAGVYPMVGVTRTNFRTLASNRGAGWMLGDFWLVNAIQMLFLVEYQTFNSQAVLGNGNVSGGYFISSADQNDSPHTIAGASNSLGNLSTDGSQPSAGAKPGIAYMSYRGIENFFGNCWNWTDGFNINDRFAHVSNNPSMFDDTSLTTNGYIALGTQMPTSNGWVTGHQNIDNAFLPNGIGGSSSTYWTDQYFQSTGLRAALFGGSADLGLLAGSFYWSLGAAAGGLNRFFGARLAF
jgi:hypothetical protein